MATEVRRERPDSDADEAPDRTQKRTVAPHAARAAQGGDRRTGDRTGDADDSDVPSAAQRSRDPSGDWGGPSESETSGDWTPSHPREDISGDWTRSESRTATRANRASVRPSAFGAPRSNPRSPNSHAGPDSQRDALPQSPAVAPELRAGRRPQSAGARPDLPAPMPMRSELRTAAALPAGLRASRERAPVSHVAPAKPARDTLRALPSTSPAARRGFATDIEELLPLAQGVRSLPKPPRLPALEPPAPSPLARRLPTASLGVFAVVVAASLTSLVGYRSAPRALLPRADAHVGGPQLASAGNERRSPSGATGEERAAARDGRETPRQGASTAAQSQQEMRGVEASSVPQAASASGASALSETGRPQSDERDAVERIERRFAGQPERLRETILEEGPRALAAGKERLAEALFARAAELGGDRAPAAAGLAQVRLAQGDLEGAEGWLLTAIRARPRNAAYRLLYANLLERGGRGHEARVERARARSLTHLSREHRTR